MRCSLDTRDPLVAVRNRPVRVLTALCAGLLLGVHAAGAQQLAAGASHSVLLKPDGTVWTWGYNYYGQLGDGSITQRQTPVQVGGLPANIVAVAAGGSHTLALTGDGFVWAWGANSSGQLGDGFTALRRMSPARITTLANITAIAAGSSHSVAMDANGVIYTWGANNNGQLGDGTTTPSLSPHALVTGWAAIAISAGQAHTLAIKDDHTLWAWGANGSGQLGNGTTGAQPAPAQVPGLSNVVAAAGGNCHSAALQANGQVFTTGCNTWGQLADGSGWGGRQSMGLAGFTDAAKVYAGDSFTTVVTSTGAVWGAGANGYGQLGDGSTSSPRSPVRAAMPEPVTQLVAGYQHSIAVSADGVVQTCGLNSSGQLGDGTLVNRATPVAISDVGHVWKVATPSLNLADGTYATDRVVTVTNATPGAEMHYTTTGVDPTTSDPSIASGGTLAVDRSMTLKVRGWRSDMPPSNIARGVYTMQVAYPSATPSGGNYTSSQTVTLSTATSGATLRYTTDGATDPTETSPAYTGPLSIATTTYLRVRGFRAGWSSSNVLWATYRMNFGTLAPPAISPADGTYTSSATVTLTSISGATIRYTTNGTNVTTSSPIYTAPLAVTSSMTIKAVAYHPDYVTSTQSSAAYTIVVANPTLSPAGGTYPAGQVIAATSDTPGAILHYTLNGMTPTQADPVFPSVGIGAGSFTLSVGAWKTGCTPSEVVVGAYQITGAVSGKSVVTGEYHTMALRGDGFAWAWGRNSSGETGDGTTTSPRTTPVVATGLTGVVQISAGGYHSVAVRGDGAVFTWGSNSNGQLGSGTGSRSFAGEVPGLTGVAAIAAGRYHTLALRNDGTVWAWGRNYEGQIGDSTTTSPRPTPVQAIVGTARAISTSSNSSYALLTDGTVWSWGANNAGQLGTGDTANRDTPSPVQGLGPVNGIVAGPSHALAIAIDGTVWAWGANGAGQLGDDSTTQRTTAVPVPGLANVVAAAAGELHSIALTGDGAVWTWGNNGFGQLGDPSVASRKIPGLVTGLPAIVAVSANEYHSFALGQDGSVWAWGRNFDGELGDGTTSSSSVPTRIADPGMVWSLPTPVLSPGSGTYVGEQIVTVTDVDAAVTMHYTTNGLDPTESDPVVASGGTIAITQNLTLRVRGWKAGANPSSITSAAYELKPAAPVFTPAGGTYTTPQSVSMSTSTTGAAIHYTTDGSAATTSSPTYTAPIPVTTTTTINAVATHANWSNSFPAVAVYTMNFGTLAPPAISPAGGTFSGQATVTMSAAEGSTVRYTTNNTAPTSYSTAYTAPLVLSTTALVRAKAFRTDYTPSAEASAAFTIETAPPVLSAASGPYDPGARVTISHSDPAATIRITLSGADPTATDPAVVSGTSLLIGEFTLKARAFKAGCVDSAAASATYSLTAQIGQGAIAAGGNSTAISTPGGRLYAWGDNWNGQLGDGTTDSRDLPVPIQTLTGVTELALGRFHAVAATRDRRLYAWGSNSGDGTTNNRPSPRELTTVPGVVAVAAGYRHTLAVTSGGAVYVWGANEDGQLGIGTTNSWYLPTPVSGITNVIAVAAGTLHSLALTADGRVYAWGGNVSGQLGDGSTTMRTTPTLIPGLTNVVEIAAGAHHSLARLSNGDVYAWGHGLQGQLGLGTSLDSTTPQRVLGLAARRIAAGAWHSLALRSDGVLVAWGYNASGQLGNGSTSSSSTPILVNGPSSIAAIAAGRDHSVAVTPTGDIWTWGEGDSGQLGGGSYDDSVVPQQVFSAGGQWVVTEAPTLSLPTGTYVGEQIVIVSSNVPGVVLHYTTTGTDPTESDPVVAAGAGVVIDHSLNLRVRAFPVSGEPSAVVAATYILIPATPTITPPSGTYTGAQLVSIDCATSGVTLRYTVDGTDPTESSTPYTAPFSIATSTTIAARAFRNGWDPSQTVTSALVLTDGVLEPPVATPEAGSYAAPVTASLSGPAGAEIRYTLDGTDPTTSSPLFSAPFEIGYGTTTLKARAFVPGWAPSATLTATYSIGMATLTVSTFLFDETAAPPDYRGVPAGPDVYVFVNGKRVGQTSGDGTLTLQVQPGDIAVTAIVPSTSQGDGSITLGTAEVGAVSIVLGEGDGVAEDADLVVAEAVGGIVPVASRTFTLQLMRDGQPVPIKRLESVDQLNRFGDIAQTLSGLFTLTDGRATATNAASVLSTLSGHFDETITLRVEAVDFEGFIYGSEVSFRVGQYKLLLTLAPPPSNPGLDVSNIEVAVSVVGSPITVHRVSDSQGHIEIEWLPHATLAFDCVTSPGGTYYYGEATMVHSWHESATLVLRHASDVINDVPPLTVDALVQTAVSGFSASASSPPNAGQTSGDAFELRRQMTVSLPPRVPHKNAALSRTAADPEPTATIDITSDEAEVPVVQTASLLVPQGTKTVTLEYNVTSLEYPQWVEQQSPFDDLWTVTVFADVGGQRLFHSRRDVNSQLGGPPSWQSDGSTGRIQEDLDVEALAANSDVQLTLYGQSVNIRDGLFPTTVSAQIGAKRKLTIKEIDTKELAPSYRVRDPKMDPFSIPPTGASNVHERVLTVTLNRPEHSHISKVRVTLLSSVGTQLQQLYEEAPGRNVKELNNGNLEVRVLGEGITSSVPTAPPSTSKIKYKVWVEVTVDGEEPQHDEREQGAGQYGEFYGLWKMPSFPRYGQQHDDPGGDYWAARGTYNWLEAHRSLITRINDISGEHGRNLVHTTHKVGTDIDMFHVDSLDITVNDDTTGTSVYERLRSLTLAAARGDDGAKADVKGWIENTRRRFDLIRTTASPDVETIIYALGSEWHQRIGPNEELDLFPGWAQELMETGQATLIRGERQPDGTWTGTDVPLVTGAGTWNMPQSAVAIVYRANHNNHIHLTLKQERMLQ